MSLSIARKPLEHLLLGALPIAAVALMFSIAHTSRTTAVDFHNEIYPQSSLMLHGHDPYPRPGSDFTDGTNFIWPPLAAFIAAPLTLLEPDTADVVAAVIEIAAFLVALWLMGVRDWRVYGASLLWPQVLGEIRVAHFSLVLCLLVAVAWRTRRHTLLPGAAIGVAVAVKFFVWPLVIWLASLRRYGEAALAAAIGAASLLLLLPYTNVVDYLRVLHELGAAYDQDSYNPYGLIVQLGASTMLASAVTVVVGVTLLVVGWRRRSLALFVAASLVLSPIVWLDYYALLALPLALVRPTFTLVWLLPLLTWGMPSAGPGVGEPMHSVRLLGTFAVILAVVVRAEGHEDPHPSSHAGSGLPRGEQVERGLSGGPGQD